MRSIDKMKTRNHNELLNSHQVNVMLAVISREGSETVAKSLKDWQRFCQSDGLHESRANYQDVARSFHNGELINKLEFFDQNGGVRQEWIKWIYNKL